MTKSHLLLLGCDDALVYDLDLLDHCGLATLTSAKQEDLHEKHIVEAALLTKLSQHGSQMCTPTLSLDGSISASMM